MAGNLLNFTNKIFSLPKNLIITQTRDYPAIRQRLLEKKLNIPPRPKRPLNAFMQFSKQERPALKLQHPKAKMYEVTKMLSDKWAECDLQVKAEYREKYKQQMIEYSRDIMNYERELTDEHKDRIREENDKMEVTREKKKNKVRLVELGKPKKPPTAFILYMLTRVPLKDPQMMFTRWVSEIGKEWQELDLESREKFEIEGKKLMDQYRTELIQWEEKMIQQGHIDVIRRQVLLDLKDKGLEEKTKKSE